MSDITVGKTQMWDYCPLEILEYIFSKLDPKSLMSCMEVCKRWMPIAVRVADYNEKWEQIVEIVMVNRGVTFKQKSNPQMSLKDLYMNSLLWLNVRHSIMKQHITYNLKDIIKLEIYRDNLIVVCKSSVKYINLATFHIIRDIRIACVDFNETDHIIMKVLPQAVSNVTYQCTKPIQTKRLSNITLYGKCCSIEFDISNNSPKINLVGCVYRLHNNCCYVIDSKFVLWKFKWTNIKWESKCLARHYGHCISVTSLNLYRDDVCIMLNWGDIYSVNFKTFSFVKSMHLEIPTYRTSFTPMVFNFHSVIIGVPKKNDFKLYKYTETDNFVLECPGLTCAVDHGDVLFLGYSDGRVEVCLPRKMMINKVQPEIVINLDKSDSPIVNLNVYEIKNAHFLLIATQTKIHRILLTYADPEKLFEQEISE